MDRTTARAGRLSSRRVAHEDSVRGVYDSQAAPARD